MTTPCSTHNDSAHPLSLLMEGLEMLNTCCKLKHRWEIQECYLYGAGAYPAIEGLFSKVVHVGIDFAGILSPTTLRSLEGKLTSIFPATQTDPFYKFTQQESQAHAFFRISSLFFNLRLGLYSYTRVAEPLEVSIDLHTQGLTPRMDPGALLPPEAFTSVDFKVPNECMLLFYCDLYKEGIPLYSDRNSLIEQQLVDGFLKTGKGELQLIDYVNHLENEDRPLFLLAFTSLLLRKEGDHPLLEIAQSHFPEIYKTLATQYTPTFCEKEFDMRLYWEGYHGHPGPYHILAFLQELQLKLLWDVTLKLQGNTLLQAVIDSGDLEWQKIALEKGTEAELREASPALLKSLWKHQHVEAALPWIEKLPNGVGLLYYCELLSARAPGTTLLQLERSLCTTLPDIEEFKPLLSTHVKKVGLEATPLFLRNLERVLLCFSDWANAPIQELITKILEEHFPDYPRGKVYYGTPCIYKKSLKTYLDTLFKNAPASNSEDYAPFLKGQAHMLQMEKRITNIQFENQSLFSAFWNSKNPNIRREVLAYATPKEIVETLGIDLPNQINRQFLTYYPVAAHRMLKLLDLYRDKPLAVQEAALSEYKKFFGNKVFLYYTQRYASSLDAEIFTKMDSFPDRSDFNQFLDLHIATSGDKEEDNRSLQLFLNNLKTALERAPDGPSKVAFQKRIALELDLLDNPG